MGGLLGILPFHLINPVEPHCLSACHVAKLFAGALNELADPVF
jgi:hypothetical protein